MKYSLLAILFLTAACSPDYSAHDAKQKAEYDAEIARVKQEAIAFCSCRGGLKALLIEHSGTYLRCMDNSWVDGTNPPARTHLLSECSSGK